MRGVRETVFITKSVRRVEGFFVRWPRPSSCLVVVSSEVVTGVSGEIKGVVVVVDVVGISVEVAGIVVEVEGTTDIGISGSSRIMVVGESSCEGKLGVSGLFFLIREHVLLK